MKTQNHTPTPWSINRKIKRFIDAGEKGDGLICVCSCDPIGERDRAIGEADARFIVRACNSHTELVEALKDAEFLLRKLAINWKEAGSMTDSALRSADDARAALQKAGVEL